jgi:hypothetical protein
VEKAFAPPHSGVMREGDTFSTGGHVQRFLKHGMGGFNIENFKESEVFFMNFRAQGRIY